MILAMTNDEIYNLVSHNSMVNRGLMIAVLVAVVGQIVVGIIVARRVVNLLVKARLILGIAETHGRITDRQAERAGNFLSQAQEVTQNQTKVVETAAAEVKGKIAELAEVVVTMKDQVIGGDGGTVHVPAQDLKIESTPKGANL